MSDSAEVRCAGRLFQRLATETGKVQLAESRWKSAVLQHFELTEDAGSS